MKQLPEKLFAKIKTRCEERFLRFRYRLRALLLARRFRSCPLSVMFGKRELLLGARRISIGEGTKLHDHYVLTVWGDGDGSEAITIGSGCNFGAYCHITATNRIIIGDNCLTGKWVTISDNDHGTTSADDLRLPPIRRKVVSKGPVVIGRNVWIGDKATILAGVTIGDGAVIGANSVVTRDVPAYSVAAGVPARVVKQI